MDTSI